VTGEQSKRFIVLDGQGLIGIRSHSPTSLIEICFTEVPTARAFREVPFFVSDRATRILSGCRPA
jgi:hypothetical protein